MRVLLVIFTLFSIPLWAGPYDNAPGLIPNVQVRRAATDLFYNGRIISPLEAEQLQIDISTIDPNPNTNLWHPQGEFTSPIYDIVNAPIAIQPNDTVTFVSKILSASGFKRDVIETADGKKYRVLFSPRVHNILLRKKLLEKLGYFIPPVKYMPKLKIRFPLPSQAQEFLKEFGDSFLGVPNRWATNIKKVSVPPKIEDVEEQVRLGVDRERAIENLTKLVWDIDLDRSEDGKTIELQDMIILPEADIMDDLSLGFLDAEFNGGRRMLTSLLLPYALTDVAESVNKLSCQPGRIINDGILLPYTLDPNGQIKPSMDDAKWIMRRIAKLDRSQWKDVVAAANYPEPVAQIMVEKLICRRNWLTKQFLPNETDPIKYNLDQNHESGFLKEGILTRNTKSVEGTDDAEFVDWWEGYGSRFSFGPDESPLSLSEVLAFGRSRVYSQGLYNLVDTANREIGLNSEKRNEDDAFRNQQKLAEEQFKEFLETGEFKKPKLSTWTTPLYNANLIVTRDVVIGSYLGTDNMVQLADTIGVSAGAGVFVGVNGGPDKTIIGGSTRGNYVVRYTHLKPIASIKAALKEPISNLAVPLSMRQAANELENLMGEGLKNGIDDQVGTALTASDEHIRLQEAQETIAHLGGCTPENISDYKELLRRRALAPLLSQKDQLEKQISESENEEDRALLERDLNQVLSQIEATQNREFPDLSAEDCQEKLAGLNSDLPILEENLQVKREQIIPQVRRNKASNVLDLFRENLGVGESFIISHGLSGSLGLNGTYTMDGKNAAMLRLEESITDLSRLHIMRKDEDTIQIYKSGALFDAFGLVFSFRFMSYPVFSLAPRWSSSIDMFEAQNQTEFFEIKLTEDFQDVDEFISQASALYAVLKSQDTDLLSDIQPPVTVGHKWKDRKVNFGLLWWRWMNQSTFDRLSITDGKQTPTNQSAIEENPRVEPEYPKANYFRRSIGTRSGSNYEEMAYDVFNAILAENDVNDIAIQNIGGGNPGDSFLGNSYFKRSTFEGRIVDNSDNKQIENPFIDVSFRWKGWKLDRDEALELIEEINEKYEFNSQTTQEISNGVNPADSMRTAVINNTEFYNTDAVYSFESLKLYRIDVNVYIYSDGVESLLGIPNANNSTTLIDNDRIKNWVLANGQWRRGQSQDRRNMLAQWFKIYRKRYKRYLEKGRLKDASEQAANLARLAEQTLPLSKLVELVGGKNNIYVRSTINGFREGAEDAEQQLFSNSIGRFGSRQRSGPMQAIQQTLGMTESEFYFYWLLGQF